MQSSFWYIENTVFIDQRFYFPCEIPVATSSRSRSHVKGNWRRTDLSEISTGFTCLKRLAHHSCITNYEYNTVILFQSDSLIYFGIVHVQMGEDAATGMAQKHSLHASLISSISLLFMRSFQSGPSIGKNLAYSCKADVEEWERDFVWEPSLRNIIAIIILLLIVESYN